MKENEIIACRIRLKLRRRDFNSRSGDYGSHRPLFIVRLTDPVRARVDAHPASSVVFLVENRFPVPAQALQKFAIGLDQTTSSAQVPFFGNNSIAFRTSTLSVEPVDIYAFYYRRQFACGGEGRFFGGFTDDSRGLLGGNISVAGNGTFGGPVGIGTTTPADQLTVRTATDNFGFTHTDGTIAVGSYVGSGGG